MGESGCAEPNRSAEVRPPARFSVRVPVVIPALFPVVPFVWWRLWVATAVPETPSVV